MACLTLLEQSIIVRLFNVKVQSEGGLVRNWSGHNWITMYGILYNCLRLLTYHFHSINHGVLLPIWATQCARRWTPRMAATTTSCSSHATRQQRHYLAGRCHRGYQWPSATAVELGRRGWDQERKTAIATTCKRMALCRITSQLHAPYLLKLMSIAYE